MGDRIQQRSLPDLLPFCPIPCPEMLLPTLLPTSPSSALPSAHLSTATSQGFFGYVDKVVQASLPALLCSSGATQTCLMTNLRHPVLMLRPIGSGPKYSVFGDIAVLVDSCEGCEQAALGCRLVSSIFSWIVQTSQQICFRTFIWISQDMFCASLIVWAQHLSFGAQDFELASPI